jgi:hypothetical protein
MPLRMRDTNRDETVVQVDEFDIFWDDGEFILSRDGVIQRSQTIVSDGLTFTLNKVLFGIHPS